jgi:hypothetical protein
MLVMATLRISIATSGVGSSSGSSGGGGGSGGGGCWY